MLSFSKKGLILFIVIGIILVVGILAIVVLRIIGSHARLTHHQVSRIQAQYAAKAGLVYALEKLRIGKPDGWTYSPTNDCPSPNGCVVTDSKFPPSIKDQQFRIIFCPPHTECGYVAGVSEVHFCEPPEGSDFCINSTTVFTYTP
jgi:hypothetical protein